MKTEERILREIDTIAPDHIRALQKMIQISSVNPPGDYAGIGDFVSGYIRDSGLRATKVHIPDKLCQRRGLLASRVNVLGQVGRHSRPNLVLNAHLDTVPAGDASRWKVDPFAGKIMRGHIFGRGACDSKGRLACYIMAASAVARSKLPLRGSVTVAATIDEEIFGDLGVAFLLNKRYLTPDYAIVEGYENAITYAQNGLLHLRAQTKGMSGHASRPSTGRNAIEDMASFIMALQKYRNKLAATKSAIEGLGSSRVSVGTINGGVRSNIIPESCSAELDIRVIPEHDVNFIYRKIERLAKSRSAKVSLSVLAKSDPVVCQKKSRLLDALQYSAHRVAGKRLPLRGLPAYTDMRHFAGLGVTSACYGPGDPFSSNVHGANENISLASLVKCSKIVALTIMHLLGQNES